MKRPRRASATFPRAGDTPSTATWATATWGTASLAAAALVTLAACQSFPARNSTVEAGSKTTARSASSKMAREGAYAANAPLLRRRPPPAPTYTADYKRDPALPSPTEARAQAKRDFAGMITPKVREMLRLVNAERRKNGLSTVVLEPRLMAAALREARDMAAHGHLSHTGSDGSHMEDRIADVQYYYTKIAENIAATRATAAGTFQQWVDSRDHYQQMMITGATQAGIAYAHNPNRPKGGARLVHYWVLLIGRPNAFYD